eukprot:7944719-Alexandrium_andersonii.AAC.1
MYPTVPAATATCTQFTHRPIDNERTVRTWPRLVLTCRRCKYDGSSMCGNGLGCQRSDHS